MILGGVALLRFGKSLDLLIFNSPVLFTDGYPRSPIIIRKSRKYIHFGFVQTMDFSDIYGLGLRSVGRVWRDPMCAGIHGVSPCSICL